MAALAKLVERFTETAVDDEIIVMRLDNGEFFALSGTAAAAWRLIDGKRDRAVLLGDLAAEFAADKSQIAADLDEFLERLKESRLVDGE